MRFILWVIASTMGTHALSGQTNLPARALGPDDLISISVYGAPELCRAVRVSLGGTVSLPLLRTPIPAAGRTPVEIEETLREALRQEGLLVDPIVSVTVSEYRSRQVTIIGAVRHPGSHPVESRLTLIELLGRAGGLMESAGAELLISRPGEITPQRIAVRDLIDRAKADANVELTGGEIVRVPEAGRIFVTGNVRRPGAFPVREDQALTVLQALALAEGLAPFHRPVAYILRRAADGAALETPVELARILKREAPDLPLQPGDTLYLPDHPTRRATAQVFDRAAGFSLATISGMLVWRR